MAWQNFLYISYGVQSYVAHLLKIIVSCYSTFAMTKAIYLYMFVTSKCFLIPITASFSTQIYYSMYNSSTSSNNITLSHYLGTKIRIIAMKIIVRQGY